MAAYNKFQDFVDQLGQGKHVFGTHVLKVVLTNSAPVATNTILANITQIANSNGYTTGGIDAQATWAEATGTGTLTGTMVVWTAVTGAMGPFQYVVLYNDTQTSPVDPLIGWWDYGSALTLQVGETFSVKFNSSATTGTILTLA
jgi:hypothetical protein